MKHIRIFLSENFQFLVVNFSIYLNRLIFVMMINDQKSDQKNLLAFVASQGTVSYYNSK